MSAWYLCPQAWHPQRRYWGGSSGPSGTEKARLQFQLCHGFAQFPCLREGFYLDGVAHASLGSCRMHV
jgi:hypothetical protein